MDEGSCSVVRSSSLVLGRFSVYAVYQDVVGRFVHMLVVELNVLGFYS